MLKIVLRRGYIGIPDKQKRILRALGLKKIGSVVNKVDSKDVRGMIIKVSHLLSVEKVDK